MLTAEAEARGLDVAACAARLLETATPLPMPERKLSRDEFRAWLDEYAQFVDGSPTFPTLTGPRPASTAISRQIARTGRC